MPDLALRIGACIDEAVLLGDRVAVMTARPGTIKATVDVAFSRSDDKRSASIRSPRAGEPRPFARWICARAHHRAPTRYLDPFIQVFGQTSAFALFLPTIFTGLRLSATLSILIIVSAEMMEASAGLGLV